MASYRVQGSSQQPPEQNELGILHMDLFNDIANTAAAIGAITAAGTAIVIAAQLRSRDRRQAFADAHLDLTTGETAQARDVIGTVLYSNRGIRGVSTDEAIGALFRLYWAVQRLENLYRVFGIQMGNGRTTKIGRLHDSYISYNFKEIVSNVVAFRHKYHERLRIADNEAWQSFASGLRASFPELHVEFFGA
jgi:hypothetical protein